MNVRIATPLRSYTDQLGNVEAQGDTVDDVLKDLDSRYPGLRFRVVDEQGELRRHMNLYLGKERVRELDLPIGDAIELTIMQALSGG